MAANRIHSSEQPRQIPSWTCEHTIFNNWEELHFSNYPEVRPKGKFTLNLAVLRHRPCQVELKKKKSEVANHGHCHQGYHSNDNISKNLVPTTKPMTPFYPPNQPLGKILRLLFFYSWGFYSFILFCPVCRWETRSSLRSFQKLGNVN